MGDNPTKEEALSGLENPIFKDLKDRDFSEKDIAQVITGLFSKIKKESSKDKIALKRLLPLLRESKSWVDMLLKLYNAYPADKRELSGPGGQPLIPPTDPKEKELLKKLADKLIEEEKRKIREE